MQPKTDYRASCYMTWSFNFCSGWHITHVQPSRKTVPRTTLPLVLECPTRSAPLEMLSLFLCFCNSFCRFLFQSCPRLEEEDWKTLMPKESTPQRTHRDKKLS